MKNLIEDYLFTVSKRMVYPLTPDLVDPVLSRIHKRPSRTKNMRRLAQAGIVALLLAAILGFIPPIRAALLDIIQIGIVRIFLPTPAEQQSEPGINPTAMPQTDLQRTAAATSHFPVFMDMENISGEMDLEHAQQSVEFPILLPSFPADIGKPDRVFVQDTNGKMAILIWFKKNYPESVRMSLHIIPEGSWVLEKFKPSVVQETLVNGKRAVWAVGPYPLIMRNGEVELVRLIVGSVLIWTNDELTFRLESNLPLPEAIQVAESLKPIENSP
jgi:hypothetical protein